MCPDDCFMMRYHHHELESGESRSNDDLSASTAHVPGEVTRALPAQTFRQNLSARDTGLSAIQ